MKPKKKIVIISLVLFVLTFITLIVLRDNGEVEDVLNEVKTEDLLHVKFLDVGDADCTFIRLPSNETVLIDTGDGRTVDSIIENIDNEIDKYGESGKKVIDYVVLTHAHSDHIGGLKELLNTYTINTIYIPSIAIMQDWFSSVEETEENKETLEMMKSDYDIYVDMINELENNNVEVLDTLYGQYIDSNKILKFVQSDKNYGPIGSDELSAEYWGLNENSAIVYLEYGKLTALFTGDMSWNAEADFYENDLLNGKNIDVLKVAHHGLPTSSTVNFIKYTNPKYGVISRSSESIDENDAITRLKDAKVNLLETSTSNGVDLYASEESWSIYK